MQTETALPTPAVSACRPSILNRLGRNRSLLGSTALALLAVGFAWQWSWLVAIGVAPLLISAAPCLAMCALGLCMHRMARAQAARPRTSRWLSSLPKTPHLNRRINMSIGNKLSIVVLAAALGGLIVPALAQNDSGDTRSEPDQGKSMGHMGQGMMRDGMMSRGMMGSGCSEMMQSMNSGGDRRPNSQWQKHPHGNPDNGG
jgi:hypothetical protein